MTIRELAKLTGKSYSTVSRALNNSPKISKESREMIQRIAGEMGYQINAGAKSLATGIHMTIGILYPYQHLREVESVYTIRLMHALRDELAKRNFDTLISGYDTIGEDLSLLTRLVKQKKVDGLLIVGYEISEEAALETAKSTDRFILINPAHKEWIRNYNHIMIDHAYGGRLAAGALIRKGCRRLGAVAEDAPQFLERIDGFFSETDKHSGISSRQFHLPSGSYQAAYRFGLDHLQKLKQVDGVFVQSDNSAFGIMNALQDSGLNIPGDIAIIGYDDVDWCEYSRPGLSTIHQPRTDAARLAADSITSWVLDGKSDGVAGILRPNYVERESC
jgi:LacI family transcriptional regulator